ncbi:MAG: TIGR03089 family protein [Actinomycetes bacterium]
MSKYFELLKRAAIMRGGDPVITWVSDAGRIELSNTTFLNSVSKAANFLVDGLELDEESSIEVELGNHWQNPVWLGAALASGVQLKTQGDILFSDLECATSWQGPKESLVVVSRDPFGMPSKDVPDGFVNGSAEVRTYGDYFAPRWSNELDVLIEGTESFNWDELVGHTRALQINYEISDGDCIGLLVPGDLLNRVSLTVVLPAIAGVSVVLIDQPNPDLTAITKQEKVNRIISN